MQESTSDTMVRGFLQTISDREKEVLEVNDALKREIASRLVIQGELAVARATIKNLRSILDDVGFYDDEDPLDEDFETLPEEPLYYDDEEEV